MLHSPNGPIGIQYASMEDGVSDLENNGRNDTSVLCNGWISEGGKWQIWPPIE